MTGWAQYLERFHAERPGITERLLSRSRCEGVDPYTWCTGPLAGRRGPVIDLACGSGPLAARVPRWVGVDVSAAELGAAANARRGPLVRGSATRLPLASAATDAVACSMAMQVLHPVSVALAEASRVMTPSGRLVLMLPAGGPLPRRDTVIYLRLMLALRRRIGYPNDHALKAGQLARTAAEHGLAISSDERRAFGLPIRSRSDAGEVVGSLYLPGIDDRALDRARRVLARRVGSVIAVPLRRVVLDHRA